MNTPSLTAIELKAEMDAGLAHVLLDVREADELEISRLPGITHIPMQEVPVRLAEIDREADVVVMCRRGIRSDEVTQFLLAQGYPRVRNLSDGMNGWARTVDPSMRQY